MVKITKDTTLAEILEQPGAEEILIESGLPCMHCPMAAYEMGMLKLEEVAEKYGVDFKDLKEKLEKLDKPEDKKGKK